MMLCMSFSYLLDLSVFAVKASLNPTALFLVSFLALVVNIAVFVYHFAKVIKYKRNIAVGVHSDLGEYQDLIAERDVQPAVPPVLTPAPTVVAPAPQPKPEGTPTRRCHHE
jgi:hypothetical protein